MVSDREEIEHFLLTGKETRHTLLNRLLVDWLYRKISGPKVFDEGSGVGDLGHDEDAEVPKLL